MKVLLRVVSVAMWLVAAFLIYAVIHALASAGGARAGVAVGYVAGAIVLTAVGVRMWRWRPKDKGKPVAAA
jgi:multisubunit Na+/H+ antiporter MnhB subunit